MKKSIVLSSALLLLAAVSFGQNTTFGFKAAVTTNYFTLKMDDGAEQKYIGNNTGFYVGGVANLQFSENFALQPNLLFAMKGGDGIEGLKINTFYIDLPVNFLYTNNGFFAGAGPNFSYGVSGTAKAEDEKVDIFDQEEAGFLTLKRFEIGANVIMGYTFPSGLSISATFTPGLNNIYKGEEDNDQDITSHNKSFGFSIGYMFGGKGKK
jgi:hypothetical protein